MSFKKNAEKIRGILEQFFERDEEEDLNDYSLTHIDYKNETILFPLGIIIYDSEEKEYHLSYDATIILNAHDELPLMFEIQNTFIYNKIPVHVVDSYYPVFDKDGTYVCMFRNEDLKEFMFEFNMSNREKATKEYSKVVLKLNKNK